jgi:hypothetical protein
MANPTPYLTHNPHVPAEIWLVDLNTRRHIGGDEYNWWNFIGCGVLSISAAWFDSIPVATG